MNNWLLTADGLGVITNWSTPCSIIARIATHTMALLDFYALGDDLRGLFEFLFKETDIVVYELGSEFDRDLRCFKSLSEVEAVFNLGAYRAGHLKLWSPSVMPRPTIEYVKLNVTGHSFRYLVRGAGLMQLYLDGTKDGIIYHTHYGHWNEAGARQRSIDPADDVDWKALGKLSGRIQRHIRGKLARAKVFSRPVLHQAFHAVQSGQGLWWGPAVLRADSPDIQLTPARRSP